MRKTKTKLSPYRLASGSTNESKRSSSNHRVHDSNVKDAWPELQLASVGMQNRIEAKKN